MTVKKRFLRYVQIETTSDESSSTCPSTPGQLTLANVLVDEMQALGIADARVDENGYVYGTIPAKGDHPARVGLIAHMDTSDGVVGPTHPQVVENYDGGPITLKNGVTVQLAVKNDKLAACGTWSCPEFFEEFEAALN